MQGTLTRLDTQSCGILSRRGTPGSWPWQYSLDQPFPMQRKPEATFPGKALSTRWSPPLTGPVAYAISVIAIVALGATLAFASGEMGETMKRLLQIGIAVCLVVFAAQVMSSFIGQAAEVSLLQPIHTVAQPALQLIARG